MKKIKPMLAHNFSKHGKKITYPCFVQPKLDGIRCIAVIEAGKVELLSRNGNVIKSVPHIEAALSKLPDAVLDGELYNHTIGFEKIASLVRRKTAHDECWRIQYHVYDTISSGTYEERLCKLRGLKLKQPTPVVETHREYFLDDVLAVTRMFQAQNFEGAMVRNRSGLYEQKRSFELQKIKQFEDAEFEIVNCLEGKGKMKGHAVFVCRTEDGTEFNVKMGGSMDQLKEIFETASWRGKKLTVRYQGYSTKNKVPRFPVGMRFYERD